MKISRLAVENFADGEAPTIVKDNISGDDLIITGENRSGKTLSFNAIIYGILGSKATFNIAPGRSSEVRISFDNDDRLERKASGRKFVHNGETFSRDDVEDKIRELLGLEDILKLHFIHSETSHLPLSSLSTNDRLRLIRKVTKSEIEDEIEQLETRNEELKAEIEENERLKLHPRKSDLEEIDLSKTERELEKYRGIHTLIRNGRLKQISDKISQNEEIKEQLESLDKKRKSLRQKIRKKNRELTDAKRYDDEINALILDAIQELTCPVCDHVVQEDRAKRRLTRGKCPQCGQTDSLSEVRENLEPKIDVAEDTIDELEDEISELKDERDEVKREIDQLGKIQPEVDELNNLAISELRDNDYDTEAVAKSTESKLETLERQYSELEEQQTELEEAITEAKEQLDELYEEQTQVIKRKDALVQQSFENEIAEFAEAWTDNYESIAPALAAEIQIQEDGSIILPGTDGIRGYAHLSTGEMRLLNLAFALTVAEQAQQNGSVDHRWECIVLDEPFTNIDSEIQKGAIEFLKTSDFQFILTTSNDDVVEYFDTDQVEELDRIPIQSTLAEVMEDA